MPVASLTPAMTTEKMLSLPSNGVERWLICGQLREKPMTVRSRWHSRIMARVAYFLYTSLVRVSDSFRWKPKGSKNLQLSKIGQYQRACVLGAWIDQQPELRGAILCGEAGCRLRRNPDTTVGIDVVYISAELAAHESTETTLIDGVPILVVEILAERYARTGR